MNQQIDITWRDLNVYIAQSKSVRAKQDQVSDSTTPMLKEYKASDTSFKVEEALELSAKSKKYDYKCILYQQTGIAKRGEITAIMGPSGAGKTTLLACLSQRLKVSQTTILNGEICANGMQFSATDFCNFGVFVMQNDLLLGTLTVKESLLFSANLRMSGDQTEKLSKVEQIIRDMNLRPCENTPIGSAMIKGISGGERKRTCIAVELIADPPVIVLDEPTSGLDSFTAYVIVDLLKKIAQRQSRTIILTIHQPSSDINNLLDRLVLLKNGKCVYQGPANDQIFYMRMLGLEVPQQMNLSDFFMSELRLQNTKLTYENFEENLANDVDKELTQLKDQQGFIKKKTANPFSYEFKVLFDRHVTNNARNPQLLKGRIISTIFFIIFQAMLYWQIGKKHDPSDMENPTVNDAFGYTANQSGVLFSLGTGILFSSMGPLIQVFPTERDVFMKEENSKQYRTISYFLSKIVVEIPMAIMTPLLISFGIYFALGFRLEAKSFFDFSITSILITLCGNGVGVLAGSMFPDAKRSAALAPLIFLPLQIFGGQYSNLGTLPAWISWFQYISPFKYFQEAYCRTQFEGITYNIKDSYGQTIVFNPLESLGMTFGLYNCIAVLAAISITSHILAYLFLKLLVGKLNV